MFSVLDLLAESPGRGQTDTAAIAHNLTLYGAVMKCVVGLHQADCSMINHLVVLCSHALLCFLFQMSTMPGLPTRPCFYDIDLDTETEQVKGLF